MVIMDDVILQRNKNLNRGFRKLAPEKYVPLSFGISRGKDGCLRQGWMKSLREGPVEFPGGSPIQLAKDDAVRGDDCPDEIHPSTIFRSYGVNKDAKIFLVFLNRKPGNTVLKDGIG